MRLYPTAWDSPWDPPTSSDLGGEQGAELLREITEHIRDVFWLSDAEKSEMLYVSPAYEHIWGRSPQSLIDEPRSFLDAIHPEDREAVAASLPKQREGNYDVEYRIIRPDGSIRWIRDRAFPIQDPDGEVRRIAGIAQDVSASREARLELEARERRYRALFEHSTEVITVFDKDRRRLYVSRAAQEVLGLDAGNPAGRPLFDRVHPSDLPKVEAQLERAFEQPGAPQRVEFRLRRNDGSIGIFEGVLVNLLEVEEVEGVMICARDVTDNRFIDPLTGLPNTHCLHHHLDFAWSHPGHDASQVSVVVIDLDRFSAITTSIGETQADQILVDVSRRLRSLISPPSMLARLHGDRFAVVLDGVTTLAGVTPILRKLRRIFDPPFESKMGPIQVSAGFGVVVSPPATSTASDVIRLAEAAVSRAKRGGVGMLEIYNDTLRRQTLQRLEVESGLRQAVKARELTVHYQPIFHLQSGKLVAFEALSRWKRGETMVPPDVFIPVAEESDLILELDLAVFEEAARQIVAWRKRFPDLRPLEMSINLSARHFVRGSALVSQVERIIERTGAPPAALKLEITETTLLSNQEAAAQIMAELRRRGINFSLDDFGTGYASISSLQRFYFSSLKIDRSFVMTLGTPSQTPDLVRGIINMAHALGMAVIAEGVESKDQLRFLREAECEHGQGYGLSRPLVVEDAESLLIENPRI